MDLKELKRNNCITIYKEIVKGASTASSISKCTGISKMTVCELLNEMVNKELLNMTVPKCNVRGRRTHHYQPSNKYFSIFIDIKIEYISTIGISTSGSVVERFDYSSNYKDCDTKFVLTNYVIKRLKNSPNYKYCTAIYILGNDVEKFDVDDSLIKTTKEDLIVSANADKSKAILFEINDKYIVSLFSHTYATSVDKNTLLKAIPFDEIRTFTGDLYFDSFDSLQKIAMQNIEKLI